MDDAREKRAKLDSLVHFDSSIASLSIALGTDASGFDPDGPLPAIPPSNASQSGRDRVVVLAEREHLTVRQLAQRLGGFSGLAFVGKKVVPELQRRGIFRREYEGPTLRENLGLARPTNSFFEA